MAGQTEAILNQILESIDRGDLNPGDPIKEQALIATYGVSRTPLREAILRLETIGLVVRQPRKGATLFKPTLEEFLAILEVHAKLEGQAAGLAARRHGREDIIKLEAVVLACERHAEKHGDRNPDGYYQFNLRFHEAVALASRNPFLLDMIKTNARKLIAYYRARYKYSGAIAASARDHRTLFELIAAGKSDEAENFMAKHVQFDEITAMDLLAARD
ncbi:GntR family transcriptional regulator [Alisedimentitalea sp. MJ-SS2]|uniref:GntR family transcriptional regulator n=1 Tax=Aliisedimentitalea sp. MJ-SS2 TaxID=3049795 RepID=UPI0029068E67|nr:GntR family transcriptional regulator [Alisedimentitalea sp. MJ-SS2]MDU8928001.1 GntR family transcriptional regulator [Alisedimentitalea sp. MJ-SS2]